MKMKIVALLMVLLGGMASAESVFSTSLYADYKANMSRTTQYARMGASQASRQGSSTGYMQAARYYEGLAQFHDRYAAGFQGMSNRTSDSQLRYSAGEEARRQQNHARNARSNAQRYVNMASTARANGR